MKQPVTVVTGASSGVGEAVALRLAGKGQFVVAIGRDAGKLEGLRDRAAENSKNIHPLALDISDRAGVQEAFARVESDLGPIEVLINNAAVYDRHDFASQDLDVMERIIDTNLKGTLYCTRFAAPGMIARKRGRIVNVASVAGTRGIPNEAVYCASKHGMVGLADSLAQELIPHGVLVTTICPGGIDTPLWKTGDNFYPGEADKLMAPKELADLVEFLLNQPAGTMYKRLVFFPTIEWH